MFLYYLNKVRGDFFEEKGTSEPFCQNDPTMIQYHVEITKILSSSQRESRIIGC